MEKQFSWYDKRIKPNWLRNRFEYIRFSIDLFNKECDSLTLNSYFDMDEGSRSFFVGIPYLFKLGLTGDYNIEHVRSHKKLNKYFEDSVYGGTGIYLAAYNNTISFLYRNSHLVDYPTGKQWFFDWERIFKGKRTKLEHIPSGEVIIKRLLKPLNGDPVEVTFTLREELRLDYFSRWFPEKNKVIHLSTSHKLVFPGKGENPWDQGDDCWSGKDFMYGLRNKNQTYDEWLDGKLSQVRGGHFTSIESLEKPKESKKENINYNRPETRTTDEPVNITLKNGSKVKLPKTQ